MNLFTLIRLGILFSLLFPAICLFAGDLPDAQDHPLLKRFAGSEIVGYDAKRFDQYELQTSTFKTYNLKTKRREYASPPLSLEGAVTRIWYEATNKASAVELMRNYQNELLAKKYTILYDSSKDAEAVKWSGYLNTFAGNEIRTSRSSYVFYAAREKGLQVCTARLERSEGDVYVQLTALQWDKDNPTYKARQGAYIAVDIIEVRPMTQNMVVVSADEMARSLGSIGKVALYGIFFDFNKAEIKEESKATLQEISTLLKKEPGLKLHVVGHTDNIGGLESNLVLSKKRAEAVVRALGDEYDVDVARLTANGVAFLAPLAVNTSEEGRAKNRRVELLPQ